MSKFVDKDHELAIRSKLIHRSYEDREGIKKFVSEVVTNEFLLMEIKAS